MFYKKNNFLVDIINMLVEHRVDFIVCGGVALVLHGVERMTLDLDLSVGMEHENLSRFLQSMKKLDLDPRAPVPAESVLDPEKRKMMIEDKNALVFTFIDRKNPYRQVDLFITDQFSYDRLIGHVEKVAVGDATINLISKEKLLEMKKSIRPPRDKDLYDIRVLEKIMRGGGEGR